MAKTGLVFTYNDAKAWRRCRLKYQFRKTITSVEREPRMVLGSVIHKALASFYSSPPTWRTQDMLLANFRTWLSAQMREVTHHDARTKGAFQEINDKGERMLDVYWNKYGVDEQWEKGRVEDEVICEFSFGTLLAHPDLHFVLPDKVVLVEHKTGVEIDMQHLALMDNQKLAYALALREVYHRPVSMVFNTITAPEGKKAPVCERFDFPFPDCALDEQCDTLEKIASEMGLLPIYPAVDLTCDWSCEYVDICRVRLSGGNAEDIIERKYIKKGENNDH